MRLERRPWVARPNRNSTQRSGKVRLGSQIQTRWPLAASDFALSNSQCPWSSSFVFATKPAGASSRRDECGTIEHRTGGSWVRPTKAKEFCIRIVTRVAQLLSRGIVERKGNANGCAGRIRRLQMIGAAIGTSRSAEQHASRAHLCRMFARVPNVGIKLRQPGRRGEQAIDAKTAGPRGIAIAFRSGARSSASDGRPTANDDCGRCPVCRRCSEDFTGWGFWGVRRLKAYAS